MSEESDRNDASQSEDLGDEASEHGDSDENNVNAAAHNNNSGGTKMGKDADDDDDDSSDSSDDQPTAASGAPKIFDGGPNSDDEANSWEEELTESDGSHRGDDYYDQEDYDDETSPSPRKDGEEVKAYEAPDEEYDSEDDGKARMIMNVYCTEYDIIKKVARKVCGFKLREYHEDHDGAVRRGEHNQRLNKEWDVSWHDLSIAPDFLAKLNPYQKVNHYPGMYVVTRKNHLARNLMRMKRAFPEEFNFFPQTWVLPGDNIDFRNQFDKQKA